MARRSDSVSLKDNELFVGLSRSELAAVEALGEKCDYKVGKTVFSEGSPGTHISCMLSGRVELSVNLSGTDEAPVHLATGGSVFGEFILLHDEEHMRTATARAVKKSIPLLATAS